MLPTFGTRNTSRTSADTGVFVDDIQAPSIADASSVDVFERLVDNAVQANVDLLLLGLLLTRTCRSGATSKPMMMASDAAAKRNVGLGHAAHGSSARCWILTSHWSIFSNASRSASMEP